MAPLQPQWEQPSHPDVQEVVVNEKDFATKSISRVSLPPFGLFADMAFPPCTVAAEPTYATVQFGEDQHLNLNSDLLYINHSCEPSLIFDTANLQVLAGPAGLRPGDELTFFYPSTEWDMAQPFTCLCGTPSCRGTISGARSMSGSDLQGLWVNGHIRKLRREQELSLSTPSVAKSANGTGAGAESDDATSQALKNALGHAEKVVEAAREALRSYSASDKPAHRAGLNGTKTGDAVGAAGCAHVAGSARRGPTSRELAGEMGGDTIAA